MTDFICPHCKKPGVKQFRRAKCTACHARHQNEYMERVRESEREARAIGRNRADMTAMQGFNPISQHYLSIKL